ncbi:MAG: 50S ribosomal protein L4 [Candidatus Subteraquimicrobiales bacterium]|nr:50S ribosomal protein L4 [Candidatus Subteraquimicrobiales bacterium]
MLKLPVYNTKGEEVEKVELNSSIFECEPNETVVHQAVKVFLASLRSGTADTKTRKEVRGGGRKPWKQKGTGRARAGSIRSPLWKGGGVVFGPTPRDFSPSLPKKMKRLALKSALSTKVKNSELVILSDFELDELKTKKAEEVLRKVAFDKKVTVVISLQEEKAERAIRNLPNANIVFTSELNPYFVLDNKVLIFTKQALSEVEEALAK